jgi:3-methyladenine DNA glycosylase/8-oxoguanine DNA glycosylase
MRLATAAHALVKTLVGQRVTGVEAARLQRAVVSRVAPEVDGLRLPPTASEIAAMAPAEAVVLGLAGRRAATLARAARTLDLERLATEPPARMAARLQRERGVGPWSTGVIGPYGLGRYEHGLVATLA